METTITTVDNIPAKVKNEMLKLGMNEKQFTAEAQNALQIWNNPKNTYLRKATKESFLVSLVNLCKINLSLNPVKKEAYLVPRKNGDNIEVSLYPSYIGLIKLLTDAGTVKNIQTNLIYEGCEFEIFFDASGTNFKHIPYYSRNENKGKIKGVYSLAFLNDGTSQFEHMDIEEIYEIRGRSDAYIKYEKDLKEKEKNPKKYVYKPVWITDEGEMVRKTILRRIYKYLPHSNNDEYIQNAIALDESEFSAGKGQIEMIENLLRTCTLSEDDKVKIESEFVTMTNASAQKCISYLKDNQFSGFDHMNPSQTDISEELKKRIERDN